MNSHYNLRQVAKSHNEQLSRVRTDQHPSLSIYQIHIATREKKIKNKIKNQESLESESKCFKIIQLNQEIDTL